MSSDKRVPVSNPADNQKADNLTHKKYNDQLFRNRNSRHKLHIYLAARKKQAFMAFRVCLKSLYLGSNYIKDFETEQLTHRLKTTRV